MSRLIARLRAALDAQAEGLAPLDLGEDDWTAPLLDDGGDPAGIRAKTGPSHRHPYGSTR